MDDSTICLPIPSSTFRIEPEDVALAEICGAVLVAFEEPDVGVATAWAGEPVVEASAAAGLEVWYLNQLTVS